MPVTINGTTGLITAGATSSGGSGVASNTALGSDALVSNTTGANNTAVGQEALRSNTTNNSNTAVGYQAGYSNASLNNSYLGSRAGYGTTGFSNVAIGMQAMESSTSANYQVAVGFQALQNTTASIGNVAIGLQALRANTTGSENIGIGGNDAATYSQALGSNTTGVRNVAVGFGALGSSTTAGNNTAVGFQAGLNLTGGQNTLIGWKTGTSLTTGTSNSFMGCPGPGDNCGSLITTGSKNTIIGAYTGNQNGLDIRTANNYIVLSDGDGVPRIQNNGQTTTFYSSGGAEVQVIPDAGGITGGTTGRVGWSVAGYSGQYISGDVISSAAYGMLGSDSGTSGWRIWTYSGGYAYRFQFNANGAAYNTTGTWGTISDIRIKQDIVPANSAWSDIKALAFKKYRFKSDVAFESSEENTTGFKAPTLFGLVAQEVQEISPGLVEETDSDEVEDGKLLAIKTSVLLMKATKALQEAMERIETLETKIQQLENK